MAAPAFNLFGLPLEIRERIYFYVVDVCREPLEPDLKTQLLSPTSALRSEFQKYITLLCKNPSGDDNPLGYTLNVESYPTEVFLKWTRLQLPPEALFYNIIPELRINYTVAELSQEEGSSIRFVSPGSLWGEARTLLDLLNDLFHHGPQGYYKPSLNGGENGGRCNDMFVGKLVLDIKLDYSEELTSWIDRLSVLAAECGSGSPQETALDNFLERHSRFESDILKGFADWISRFLKLGHLDGRIGSFQVLWDGAEEWDTPPNLKDPRNPIPGTTMEAFFDLAGTERRKEIVEPLGWRNYKWGRNEKFQAGHCGPRWADRWAEAGGVWTPPCAPPPESLAHLISAARLAKGVYHD
ncbi:hypothetical protein TWF481_010936 [Arthrobotrys musiformis]|uniref:Uncharacterized protein n=1 Tax=Arthrobotrys musiformis TaxID=47236 RepID=A0AAV9VWU0_9PEZI